MARKYQMVLVLVVLTTSLLHDAASECCHTRDGVCADCFLGACCGRGPCNIFCCNCDDGCRTGNCWARHRRSAFLDVVKGNTRFLSGERTGQSVVIEGDADGDGRMSLEEAHALLVRRSATTDVNRIKRDLHALDVNGDNYLSPLEIDRDADNFTPA